MSTLENKLRQLYSDATKHSNYQNIPDFVRQELGYSETIDEQWRGDSSRYSYLLDNVSLENKNVADIGANTGFFTLSLAHRFRDSGSKFTAIEANPNHATFISKIADHFDLGNVSVLERSLTLDSVDELKQYDSLLLFNVLHHAGVDFDTDRVKHQSELAQYIIQFLARLRNHAKQIVFQMGYNWGGNKSCPIVDLQDDIGKLAYTAHSMKKSGWKISKVATASSTGSSTPGYTNLDQKIVDALNATPERFCDEFDDKIFDCDMSTLSEFYRRPIFICDAG